MLQGGLHTSPKEFDFGILTSPHEVHTAPISLLNSGSQPLQLIGVSAAVPDDQLTITFAADTVVAAGDELENALVLSYVGNVCVCDWSVCLM